MNFESVAFGNYALALAAMAGVWVLWHQSSKFLETEKLKNTLQMIEHWRTRVEPLLHNVRPLEPANYPKAERVARNLLDFARLYDRNVIDRRLLLTALDYNMVDAYHSVAGPMDFLISDQPEDFKIFKAFLSACNARVKSRKVDTVAPTPG